MTEIRRITTVFPKGVPQKCPLKFVEHTEEVSLSFLPSVQIHIESTPGITPRLTKCSGTGSVTE